VVAGRRARRAHDHACGPCMGSTSVKHAPVPGELSAVSRALWFSMIRYDVDKPKPWPVGFVVKCGSKTRDRFDAGMPGPVSVTVTARRGGRTPPPARPPRRPGRPVPAAAAVAASFVAGAAWRNGVMITCCSGRGAEKAEEHMSQLQALF